jgi:hypothetical protein
MNIKRIFLLAVGLLSLNFAIAQRCGKFGIILKSNEDIAAFKTDYPGCKTVIGDLTVSGPVSHIKDLIQIDSVLGKVSVFTGYGWDEDFKSFEGLNHLRYVGGDLNLSVNRVLTDASDFDSLQYVGGSLLMYDNDLLKTLDGFPMLQHIGLHLDISQNDSLESIQAFKTITTINGNLMVYNNYVLTDLSGLENIRFVGEVLDIHHCFKLTDLRSFKIYNEGENLIFKTKIFQTVDYSFNPSDLFKITDVTIQYLDPIGEVVNGIKFKPKGSNMEYKNDYGDDGLSIVKFQFIIDSDSITLLNKNIEL